MTAHADATAIALADQLTLNGTSVTYTRGEETATIDAILTAIRWSRTDEEYHDLAWEGADFIFLAADLDDFDSPKPARMDTITVVDADATTRVYTVMSPAGVQHFRYLDADRAWVRVHTKLTSETEAE